MKDRLEIVIEFPQGEDDQVANMIANGELSNDQKAKAIKVLAHLIKELEHDLTKDEI